MIGTISMPHTGASHLNPRRAQQNFSHLVAHVAGLYCMGGSSSVSSHEAQGLAMSVAYVLGIADATADEAACVLDVEDPVVLWHECLDVLDACVEAVLDVWREIIAAMPSIRNVALRDTLASLGELRRLYDTRFAAHVVPCDIDYQLSASVDPRLMGLDYIEAWLAQLLAETRWIACFDAKSCIAVLECSCPDYRALHVDLYDLLCPHEDELMRTAFETAGE